MRQNTLIAAMVIFASLISVESSAQMCGYSATEQGDWHIANQSCTKSQIDDMWDRFDFDEGDWDGGFGFHDACNNSKPLKRTFNTLYAMKYAGGSGWTCSTSGSSMLDWAYCWSGKAIDELDARCGSNSGVIATTWYGVFVDNKTELYGLFFYGIHMAERMSTIVHEARHAQGWCSHPQCGCSHGGCDQRYKNGCTGVSSSNGYGAYGMEFNYLTWMLYNSSENYEWLREGARRRIQEIMPSAFCEDPCIRVDDDGDWYRSC